jgi:hypothetical protein
MAISQKEYERLVSEVNEKGIKKYFTSSDGKINKARRSDFEIAAKEFYKTNVNSLKAQIIEEFRSHLKENKRGNKNNLIRFLATKHKLYKGHLEKKLGSWLFECLCNQIETEPIFFDKNVWPAFETIFTSDKSLAHVRNSFKKILASSIHLATRGGFLANFSENEAGIQDANEGDASQFLFLGRAIMSGLNCSNVDVRSSKYDAILDREGKLTRIQIKGFSDGKISFFSRPRGGQGIDSTHARNLAARVSSKDCDFFSAVDKLTGICYNIPISYIEKLPDKKAKSCSAGELAKFKEKWDFPVTP